MSACSTAADDDEDVEGSRLPLLIVIALLVLAAFGGVVWLAYQRGVQQGHAEVPRVIAAEPGTGQGSRLRTPAERRRPTRASRSTSSPRPSNEGAAADAAPPAPSQAPAANAGADARAARVDAGRSARDNAAANGRRGRARAADRREAGAAKPQVAAPPAPQPPPVVDQAAPPRADPCRRPGCRRATCRRAGGACRRQPARRRPAADCCRSAPTSPRRTPTRPGQPTRPSMPRCWRYFARREAGRSWRQGNLVSPAHRRWRQERCHGACATN